MNIQICSNKWFRYMVMEDLPQNAALILCSSYEQAAEKYSRVKNRLILIFDDITNERSRNAFTMELAERIKDFIVDLPQDAELYICCDSGESRSAAIAAAILRYNKQDDMSIWRNPYYHPNPLVFRFQCRVLNVPMSDVRLKERLQINQQALKDKISGSE